MSNADTKVSLKLELKIARHHNVRQSKKIKQLEAKIVELECELWLSGVKAIQGFLESQQKNSDIPLNVTTLPSYPPRPQQHVKVHDPSCASLTVMLTCYPPKQAACNCTLKEQGNVTG
jgi:hypothetical protein